MVLLAGKIENASYFRNQCGISVGLLKEVDVLVKNAVPHDHVVGISRDK